MNKGEAVTFIGRTGAGKSTVFRLLLGLYRPLEGRVLIKGSGASGIPDEKKRRLIGYVEQSFHLVEGTVAEQISLFDPAVARKQVENAAKLVGLHATGMARCTIGVFSCRKIVHTLRVVSAYKCFLERTSHQAGHLVDVSKFNQTA